jgi:hypothetical protein
MKQLHITLGSGDTHDVELQPFSMLIVRTRKLNDLGVTEDVESAFSDVADVEIVEVEDEKFPEPHIIQESPYLGTPETAAQAARELPAGDGAQLVEQGLEKFPGDEGLLAAQAEISAKLQAAGQAAQLPAADTVEEVEEVPAEPVEDPFAGAGAAPVEEQQPIETAEPRPTRRPPSPRPTRRPAGGVAMFRKVDQPLLYPASTLLGNTGGPVVDTGIDMLGGGRVYIDRVEAGEIARHFGFDHAGGCRAAHG